MTDIPWWVEESYETFLDTSARSDEWIQDGPETFSKIRSIHYPPRVHVLFVVDALKDDGWVELPGTHYSEEIADNAARKRAYSDAIPHRVRIVVAHE